MSRRHARPSAPSPATVRSRSRHAMPARPPSSGCAYDTSGTIQSIRSSRPSLRNTGDARAAGCTAEHTSCRNPGSVSPAERTPPPIDDSAS